MTKSKRRNWGSLQDIASYLSSTYDLNVRVKIVRDREVDVLYGDERKVFKTYAAAFDFMFDMLMTEFRKKEK